VNSKTVGYYVTDTTASDIIASVEDAERIGMGAAWLISGGVAMDPITLLAAAATHTKSIKLGTAIVPFWPKHPLSMAQQVMALSPLAKDRFRLGIGPSGSNGIRSTYGIDYKSPLAHMKEYIKILKALLQEGSVDLDGKYYTAHAEIDSKMNVPIMASALRKGSFELCGAEADGAITYICPGNYIHDVALPAMKMGAEEAGRPTPPIIASVVVCLNDKIEEVRETIKQELGFYTSLPDYVQMFTDAGFPECSNGKWSDRMVDAIVCSGSETDINTKLNEMFEFGASELWIHIIGSGPNKEESLKNTKQFIGEYSKSI
jgi:F420-dependent oxidoreductase-like protein